MSDLAPGRASGAPPGASRAQGDALRLVAAAGGSLALAAVSSPTGLAAALAVSAAACAVAMRGRPAARARLWVALAGVAAFCALLWAVSAWPRGAEGAGADPQRTATALAITLRAHAVLLWCAACLARLDETRLVAALRAMRCPPMLCALLELSLCCRGVVADVWRRQSRAMRARGFRPAPTRAALTLLGEAIGLLVIDALERAERIERAMLARGWSPDVVDAPTARRR